MAASFDLEQLKTVTLTKEKLAGMATTEQQKESITGLAPQEKYGEIQIQTDAEVVEKLTKGSAYRELAQFMRYTRRDMKYWTQQSSPWLTKQRANLTPLERIVFDHLQDNAYWYNWVLVSRKLISEALPKMDEKTITGAIKKLHSLGLIEKITDADQNWGAGPKPSQAELDYRQDCWSVWQSMNKVSHGKGIPRTLPPIPAKASWYRISNAVMWRGHVKYMWKVPDGAYIANRTERYFSWLAEYNQDPELLAGLLDTERKGKTMDAILDRIRLKLAQVKD